MTQTRDQRIVAAYERDGRLRELRAKLRSRARDLPAMLRRHGLLQVLSFLAAKKKDDLVELLSLGIGEALQEQVQAKGPTRYREHLAGLSMVEYLRHQEAALTAASWLKLLVEAHSDNGASDREEAPSPEAGGGAS